MGLDVWGVKLKPGVPIYLANWDTIEDLDETDILPQSNYFYNHSYSSIHQSFIDYIIKESGSKVSFTGQPCCSPSVMNEVSLLLSSYMKNNDCDMYNWIDEDGSKKVLTGKEARSLAEYINLLHENGFVMWFSL